MENNFFSNPYLIDPSQSVSNRIKVEGETVVPKDPISLDIEDTDLLKTLKSRRDSAIKFYKSEYNLYERREKNEKVLFGRHVQIQEKNGEFKKYDSRQNDNVLYEIEESLVPLAVSHLPDIIVLAGSDNDEQKKTAKDLSLVIDSMNKKRQQRRVMALGFRHLPVYFTAVVKAVWDSVAKDYKFINIHPDLVVVDETAKTSNSDDMHFISEKSTVRVQDLFMHFPDKEEKLRESLKKKGLFTDEEKEWKDLDSDVDMYEEWFTWYEKPKKSDSEDEIDPTADSAIMEPGNKWKVIEGVIWRTDDLILKKTLNPYFDHEGEEKMFILENPADANSAREVKPEDVIQMAFSGQPLNGIYTEKVYHNYFDRPQKPYFFFSYNQWGKIAYDETSRIEQNLPNQESLDLQERQIDNTLKQRRKHIWSGESGLKAEDIQNMDMDNPNLDALIDGDVNTSHKSIEPERPDAAQFNSVSVKRDRMFSLAGANAIRGDLQTDVATTNQIAREANFTRNDAVVEETINACSEWMAQWQMQFIKLFYTEEHLRKIVGARGSVTYVRLRRDVIDDGMEVVIKSSTTDKLRAQKNANEMAGLKMIDPYTYYEDMGMSDPEGRVEKLMLFNTDPAGYQARYGMGLDTTQKLAGALDNQPLPVPTQPKQLSLPVSQPSPTDTQNVPIDPPDTPQGSTRVI